MNDKLLSLLRVISENSASESFFIYDFDRLEKNVDRLKTLPAASHDFDVCTHPHPMMVKSVISSLQGKAVLPNQSSRHWYDTVIPKHRKILYEYDDMVIHWKEFRDALDVSLVNAQSVHCADATSQDMDQLQQRLVTHQRRTKRLLSLIHGQSIFEGASFLCLRVRATKTIRNKKYVIVSGGINLLWETSNRRKKYNFSAPFLSDSYDEQVTLCGPLCTPQDTLARDVMLPEVLPGDLVMIEGTDLQSYTQSPFYFISHPEPALYILSKGQIYHLPPMPKIVRS